MADTNTLRYVYICSITVIVILTYTYVVYRGTPEADALYSDGWSSVFAEDES